jgi:hypothetical protein
VRTFFAILRRHLLDKEPVSKLCNEIDLKPTVLYRWHRSSSKNEVAAFEHNSPTTLWLRATWIITTTSS